MVTNYLCGEIALIRAARTYSSGENCIFLLLNPHLEWTDVSSPMCKIRPKQFCLVYYWYLWKVYSVPQVVYTAVLYKENSLVRYLMTSDVESIRYEESKNTVLARKPGSSEFGQWVWKSQGLNCLCFSVVHLGLSAYVTSHWLYDKTLLCFLYSPWCKALKGYLHNSDYMTITFT